MLELLGITSDAVIPVFTRSKRGQTIVSISTGDDHISREMIFSALCEALQYVFCLIYSKEQLSDYSRCSVKYQFNAGKFSCQYFTVIRQRVMT